MKFRLLRYNTEPLTLNTKDVARISGISQSNIIVIMKTGESHTGYLIQFD